MRNVLAAIRATPSQRLALTDAFGPMTYGQLTETIAQLAATLADSPRVIGLLMPRDRRHVAGDLALASLGRTIVVLPDFFSPEQWRHMIADAGIEAIVTTAELAPRLDGLDVPVLFADPDPKRSLTASASAQRIIYTSGTTGKPKGVVLSESALDASLSGLIGAVGANARDVHLSLLPFSLLLEQLAGILLPLMVGARIHIAASPLEAEAAGATTSVVVPDLLAAWVRGLKAHGGKAPASLRFVAVGGAPVGEALAATAWDLGLPVHEGYGLSECCSVVAVNRPGQRRPGTVGRILDGLAVSIEDGEIVVRGPTVMNGYLGHDTVDGAWRTGDLGRFESDGHLVVLGRKDDVIVTAQGRNIHPEWIEPMLLAEPSIRHCAIIAGLSGVRAIIVPADNDVATVHDDASWLWALRRLTATAPAYAQPAEISIISAETARAQALFTVDGRPRRRRIAQFFVNEVRMSFYQTLVTETEAERGAFLSIPLIAEAVQGGVDLPLYLSFLHSAYHHVRYTVPLLESAQRACGGGDETLAAGLAEYVSEESGHDEWILADITALGGDGEASRHARPPLAVRLMVAHAFHLIAEDGPYALLGMVHVLEGMSVALAVRAAQSIQTRLAVQGGGGFSYLSSHGTLDIEHVDGFIHLLEAIDTPERRAVIIAAAKEFYLLYGNVFRALRDGEVSHAA